MNTKRDISDMAMLPNRVYTLYSLWDLAEFVSTVSLIAPLTADSYRSNTVDTYAGWPIN